MAYDVGGMRLAVAGADGSGERFIPIDVSAIARERPPAYGPPAIAAAELQLRAAAGDLLRVMRDQDEDVAWQHSLRVRRALRARARPSV